MCLLISCSPTKYVPKDKYLLIKNNISIDNRDLSKNHINRLIRQQPNTKILGLFRFHLGLYNLSGQNNNKGMNRWLKSIGEAPVILDENGLHKSNTQILNYLRNKGFYSATVIDTILIKKKKATINYIVTSGPATKISKISYFKDLLQDSVVSNELQTIKYEILHDAQASIIKEGQVLDIGILENERERITKSIKNKGYYNFSKNFIHFYADTTNNTNQANLVLSVLNNGELLSYKKYYINDIVINLDYDPLKNEEKINYSHKTYNNIIFNYVNKSKIKPKLIDESILFQKEDCYNLERINNTYSRLQNLGLFKFINVSFDKSSVADSLLNCMIRLTPSKRQAYNVFLEGTNNSGNIGVGGNFSYTHKNLFKGGESFQISIWGALKKEQISKKVFFNTTEFGSELKLTSPQFWLPLFRFNEFRRKYAPKTSISISYSQESTPYYKRSIFNSKFGYFWRPENKKWIYGYDLIDLNYVLMQDVDPNFTSGLKSQSIRSAYESHLILSSNFSTVYSNKKGDTKVSYSYFRSNLESSGNVLYGINKLLKANYKIDIDDKYNEILKVRYAQFLKADGEYRYNQYINKANTIVYRIFGGIGYPYGNMSVLPFEESYFCGGANGIRAWNSRTLGPGTYQNEDKYPNSVGELKLEANIEYRFKLIWLLEGALFLDAGNIWNINPKETRKDAKFTGNFYRQIAIGTGLGIRLDVNFFLLRFDLGLKMIDPLQDTGNKFVLISNERGLKRSVFNIAIGYPF